MFGTTTPASSRRPRTTAGRPRPRWLRRAAPSDERGILSALDFRIWRVRLGYWVAFAVLLVLTLTTFVPLYWLFSDSVRTSQEIGALPPSWIPQTIDWGNISFTWNLLGLGDYLNHTLILVGGALILQLLVSVTAAFSLSKLKPAFGTIILGFFLVTLLVPPVCYLIPQYVNINALPLVQWNLASGDATWLGILLPEAVSAFNLFLLKSFFDDIPDELIAAARIDGANTVDLLVRIVLPMSRAVLAVIAIFTLMATWKDFLWPYVVTSGDLAHQNLMVYMYTTMNSRGQGTPISTLFAAYAMIAVPPIVLFVIFQRQIIRGIALTGLTG
jgi:multiple sugar transport system permease protein